MASLDESRPSRASAARLSLYLRCLEALHRDGRETASSREMAEILTLDNAQIRKDLSALGSLGRRGVGYRIVDLIAAIRKALGIDRHWPTVLIGAGNLSRALMRYRGFAERGFQLLALFDADPRKVGQKIEGLSVQAMDQLQPYVREHRVELGIIAVPSENAQDVADVLIAAGIRGLLNFAPAVLRLPETVRVVNVDLTIQLEQLAFQIQNRLD